MKINVIETISNRKYTYTKGQKNNLLILECDWMKHFILKNEITITRIKKEGGGDEHFNFECYLFLS